ncbi:MAG: Ring hydroxylating beta subunit, partial [Chloroflexota bacterium]|nr:Ring hydroxylating beta subunit [Chloroflexota bacterium]
YRLKIPTIGPQSPPPSYRHLVGNVMPAWTADNELSVVSSQVVFFSRQGRDTQYAGTWEHVLTKVEASWRIRRKKVSLINCDQSLWQLPLL